MWHCSINVHLQPDTVTGDIVFVLQLKEHPKFKRKFDDLYVEHTLSLTEALCGFQFALTHLDGRQLLIKSNPGEVVKPGMVPHDNLISQLSISSASNFLWFATEPDQYKAINDEGMPHYQRPFMKGRLFIHFNVEFPDSGFLSPDQCHVLEATLAPRTGTPLTAMELDECEETTLYDVSIEEEMRRKHQQHQNEAYDEDDDDDSGPRVQCAQQ